MPKITAEQIDALLPQTQCGLCDYAGCLPYAQAIANQGEQINRCPPGGVATLKTLGKLLHQDVSPYLAEMAEKAKPTLSAVIREDECIGCTKCIQACPVDAILGSAKHMHTIITDECTGCELCIAPCPVDCIDLIEMAEPRYHPEQARQRFEARNERLTREASQKRKKHVKTRTLVETDQAADRQAKQAFIAAAIKRVKEKRLKAKKAK